MDNPTNSTPAAPIDSQIVSKKSNLPADKAFKNKKIIIIGMFGIVVVIITVFLFVISSKKVTNNATPNAEIQLKTEYKNPFDKNAQYDNPFENLK